MAGTADGDHVDVVGTRNQASEGAVLLLSKAAAVDYARQGVRINSVHCIPG